jgi:bacillolysin
MKYLKLTASLIILLSNSLFSQNIKLKEVKVDNDNKITFAIPSVKIASTLQNENYLLKTILKEEESIGFKLDRIAKDDNFIHHYYTFNYQGIKIDGADYVVHSSNGNIDFANGSVPIVSSKMLSIPKIGLEKAKGKLSTHINSEYKKSNSDLVNFTDKGVVWLYKNKALNLAYKIETECKSIRLYGYYYVDANTGINLGFENFICAFNKEQSPPYTPGIANTLYSGTQTITTDANFNGGFRLRENRNGVDIHTLNVFNLSSTSEWALSAVDFWDNDNNWLSSEHSFDKQAFDIHWGAEKVFDYWKTVHNRNSIDGNGMLMRSYVHAGTLIGPGYSLSAENAFWTGGTILSADFGDGGPSYKPLTSLDVCAHEFGHGINQFAANGMSFMGESGALNEGFSDIWGACIEAWAAPTKQRWLHGEEIVKQFPFFERSMSNPKTSKTPGADTYGGQYYGSNYETPNHVRGGVAGKWFFLISDGGTGTNDFGSVYLVNGLGIDKASKIAYRTVRFLNQVPNYSITRQVSIQAARDLYGIGSCEEIAVTNAWYAVGVGGAFQISPTVQTIIGAEVICTTGSSYTLNNIPCNGVVSWTIACSSGGNPTLSTTTGNSTSINIPSVFPISATITLTATVTGGITVPTIKTIFYGQPGFGASYKNGVTGGNPVAIYFPNQGSNNIFNNVCIGFGFPNVYVDAQPYGTSSVAWSVPSGYSTSAFSLNQQNGNRAYFSWNYGGTTPPGYLQASVSNTCGNFSQIFAFKQVNCNPTGGNPCDIAAKTKYFTVSPNPARDIINIGIGNKPAPIECPALNSLNGKNGITFSQVNIYNNLGSLLISSKTNNSKQSQINIDRLKAGIYSVEIITGDYIEKQQIIIQE